MFFKRRNTFRDTWWKKALRIFGYTVAIITIFMIVAGPAEEFGDEILVIPITGTIYSGSDGYSPDTFSDDVISQLESAAKNDNTKAVILELDSPGGTVVGSREISNAIESFDKPIVTWMRENAASGAYWIAASTDHIVADPATITGSIGVTGSYLQFAGLLDDYNVSYERFVSGEYKDTGSPYKEVSDAEREYLQNKINLLNDMFVEHVATSRGLTESFVRSHSNGEIFLGTEALSRKLVDSLGGKQEALDVAAELSGAEDYRVTKHERPTPLFGKLFYGFSENNLNAQTSFGARA